VITQGLRLAAQKLPAARRTRCARGDALAMAHAVL